MTDDEIYEYLGQVFEWDRRKAAMSALNHRVRFTEAATALLDPFALFSSTIPITLRTNRDTL